MATEALHGVNLAGWLGLEQWVTPELFAGTGSLGEQNLVDVLGDDLYRELISNHRSSFVTETDFKLIARRGFNAVRLPVPDVTLVASNRWMTPSHGQRQTACVSCLSWQSIPAPGARKTCS